MSTAEQPHAASRTAPPDAAVVLEDLALAYGRTPVLTGVTGSLRAGQALARAQ